MCLNLATFNYKDEQLPTVVACQVFELAAIRTLYPIDLDNLAGYAPGSIHTEGADLDNFNAMLEAGSRHLGLEVELDQLNAEAARLWAEFHAPRPLELPSGLEGRPGGERNARLHYQALKAFHDRA